MEIGEQVNLFCLAELAAESCRLGESKDATEITTDQGIATETTNPTIGASDNDGQCSLLLSFLSVFDFRS